MTASLVASFVLVFAAGCGEGGSSGYSGDYKRELSNEGEVQMKLGGGSVELTLPSPRWADNPTIKSNVTFKGDTLVFPADSGMACATAEAKYVLDKSDNGLNVDGVGFDSCGGRHAALEGTWEKT
ncbi:MAG TPA: hypothetical protein VFW66_06815 [Gemmatimonadales bacterium]|nr:hypothetical protein [Gemmatimonadales bacterium]